MRKLKKKLIAVNTLIGALLFFSCTKAPKPLKLNLPPTGSITRGAELVEGLSACAYCHGREPEPYSPLEGGRKIKDSSGELFVPNITPSKSGIGSYSLNDIVKALRENESPKIGRFTSNAHKGYEWLSDYDAFSIALYLKSLKPIEKEVPIRREGVFHKYTLGLIKQPSKVKGFVPRISRKNQVEWGRYLVDHAARCGFCHNSPSSLLFNEGYLEGGKIINTPDGEITVPALRFNTANPISSWGVEEIINYLRTGLTPDGKQVTYCPVNFYKNAGKNDLEAIAVYFKKGL
ncbi:MAG: hypothetical protein D6780_05905 [Candidatus Dadabacteria bacterium]|nr:MAG: hypothetical protein D6780_05905 [Candidatus Dadabacteria bacterium]